MRYRVAMFALFCGTVAAQTLTDEASVNVVLAGEGLPPAVLAAMQREAESAIAPSGVTLTWVSSQELEGSTVAGQMAIIRFRGQCRPATSARAVPTVLKQGGEPLGQTHMVDGKVLPIADVLCEAVRQLVDRDLRRVRPTEREELLGRALGRVLAHELYHILLRTTDHGHRGLSRSEQSSAELLAPSTSFVQEDERRISESVGADSGGR